MTLLSNSKSKIVENYKVNNIGWRCIKELPFVMAVIRFNSDGLFTEEF